MAGLSDILLMTVVLIWIPLIPMRFILHTGIGIWRRFGDLSYLVCGIYWCLFDILLVASRDVWTSSPWRFQTLPVASWLGWALLLFGIGFGYWAASTLGFIAFTTRPQLSPKKSASTLIATGPYRLVRHPFYFSEWFILLGATLITRSWLALGLVLLAFILDPIIAKFEEKELVERLGKSYEDYRKKVPRLLPTFSRK